MEIHQASEQGVTVITIEGRLDAPGVPQAEKVFQELIDSDTARILLDLAGVEYISSSGLRLFIMLAKATDKSDRKLAFCRLSPFVLDVLEITHLTTRFDIYPSREEALEAIQERV
jgi:anti-anti-sigma factor